MAEDERVRQIGGPITAAVAALAGIPDESRTEGVKRLEEALGFARVALDATDPTLITEDAANTLAQAAMDVANDPAAAIETPSAYADDIIQATLALPVTRGRDVEQAVKEAASNYQRAMAHRIKALEDQHTAAQEALAETHGQIAAASEEFKGMLAERAEGLRTEVEDLEQKIAAHQAALDAQLTRHTEAFNATLEENAQKFQLQADTFTERFEEQVTAGNDRIEKSVASVEETAKNVGVLAGAISLKETAKYYEDEADAQETAADRMRYATILVTFAAVAIGVWAVLVNAEDTHALGAKLAVSAILGGLATYTASQSGKHRQREVRARDLQLQLTAFSPFIAPLDPELQQVERIRMTHRTFGVRPGEDDDVDEYGPNLAGFVQGVLRRGPDSQSGGETA